MSQHSSTPKLLRAAAAIALIVPPAAATAGGSDLDLSMKSLRASQAVQDGHTFLLGGRSTFLRAGVIATGTVPPGTQVDGILHVFADGVEVPDSPHYSINGPMTPQTAPLDTNLDHTLNFVFVAPEAASVVLTVELNPAGPNQVFETDYSNNMRSTPSLPYDCRRTPELVYVPIDYRPTGGPTPNLPDEALIKPGVGDNFVQGIYPSPDWHYFQAPVKLWTNSLSGTGSGLLSALAVDINLMVPQPDFIYGWIPGGLPYNGQAIGIPGISGIGNTQPIRHQRTFAHELGHLFGLSHNNADTNTIGIDTEHHLNLTEALPQLKADSLKDIMAAGLLTNQAWVWPDNYKYFFDHVTFQCTPPPVAASGGDSLMVAGMWDRETGQLELTDTLVVDARPSPTVSLERADLVLRVVSNGTVTTEAGILVNTSTDTCSACRGGDTQDSVFEPSPITSFVVVLPTGVDAADIDELTVVDPRAETVLAQLTQSESAPEAAFVSPKAGELLGSVVELEWAATDADSDALRFYVRYSPDGQQVVPLAANIADASLFVDMRQLPQLKPGFGYFELMATDGLHTTTTRLDDLAPGAAIAGAGGSAPTVNVLTPDTGKSFPFGATVILHSSGWDLEDRVLDGASITWTSDLDGAIGTGRVTSVASLSVGTHVLTVTAEDSGALTASDTTTITISPRDLPGENCQTDLGQGGPGSAVLTVCGGDLSSGTTVDIEVTGAAPNETAWLLYSLTSAAIPAGGGTIVPFPPSLIPAVTDASGDWSALGVNGGGGPFSLFLQFVYMDGGEPFGVGISNAVRADFLP